MQVWSRRRRQADITAELSISKEVAAWLDEQELSGDEADTLLIRRTIDTQGKEPAFVNGVSVTLTQLRDG